MPSARDSILAGIRRSLGRGPLEESTRAELERRCAGSNNLVRPQLEPDAVARFCRKIEQAAATLETVASARQIPTVVAAFLRDGGLAPDLVLGEDPVLLDLDWTGAGIAVAPGVADGTTGTSLSRALLGVAETGSLLLRAGRESPTSNNFLPEAHIVVVDANRVVPFLEDAWTQLRQTGMPRAANFVTGPSRTADIEQTIQLGAHGPRYLHVILVGSADPG